MRKVGAVFVHTPLCSGTVCTNKDPASVQSRRPSCIHSCNPPILLLISWTIISSMNTFTLRDNTQFKRNEPNSQCTKPSQAHKQNIDTNSTQTRSHSPKKKFQLEHNAQPNPPDPKDPNIETPANLYEKSCSFV